MASPVLLSVCVQEYFHFNHLFVVCFVLYEPYKWHVVNLVLLTLFYFVVSFQNFLSSLSFVKPLFSLAILLSVLFSEW